MAQPSTTRNGYAAFEHHLNLPQLELENATATIMVGSVDASVSPVRRYPDHVGAELNSHGGSTTMALDAAYEYAMIVVSGEVLVDNKMLKPGQLAYLVVGHDECDFTTTASSEEILVGGVPFEEKILMWWNFVARSQHEIAEAWLH